MRTPIQKAAAAMGSVKSEAKTAAARANGAKGGRPTLLQAAQNRLKKAYQWVGAYSAYYGKETPEQREARAEYAAATENLATVASSLGATPETVAWIREAPHMAARGHEVPLT